MKQDLVCEIKMTFAAKDANVIDFVAKANGKPRDRFLADCVRIAFQDFLAQARRETPREVLQEIEQGRI